MNTRSRRVRLGLPASDVAEHQVVAVARVRERLCIRRRRIHCEIQCPKRLDLSAVVGWRVIDPEESAPRRNVLDEVAYFSRVGTPALLLGNGLRDEADHHALPGDLHRLRPPEQLLQVIGEPECEHEEDDQQERENDERDQDGFHARSLTSQLLLVKRGWGTPSGLGCR